MGDKDSVNEVIVQTLEDVGAVLDVKAHRWPRSFRALASAIKDKSEFPGGGGG